MDFLDNPFLHLTLFISPRKHPQHLLLHSHSVPDSGNMHTKSKLGKMLLLQSKKIIFALFSVFLSYSYVILFPLVAFFWLAPKIF